MEAAWLGAPHLRVASWAHLQPRHVLGLFSGLRTDGRGMHIVLVAVVTVVLGKTLCKCASIMCPSPPKMLSSRRYYLTV